MEHQESDMNDIATAIRKTARTGATRKSNRPTPANHCVGIVVAMENERFTISSGAVVVGGRCAASCLLEPAIGDSVACLLVAPDEVWILAVLMREEGIPNRLLCRGATRLEVEGGDLTLKSVGLEMETARLTVRAEQMDVNTNEAVVVGREFRFISSTLKLVGSLFSSVFDRVNHFSKHHQRTTEGLDRVQANYLEQDARQLLRLSGESTVITGQTLIKAQANQVHIG
jgi:hypothetical protein